MNEFNEDELVQKTTAEYLRDSLGWEIHFAHNTETFGESGTFGRKDDREVLLKKYLLPALRKLNPDLPEEAYQGAMKKLSDAGVGKSLEQINRDNYKYLLNGVPVEFQVNGKFTQRNLQLIDFDHADNNHFLAVREFFVKGYLYRRRADIMGFINGIPVIFIELKNVHRNIRSAFEDNLKDYKTSVPQLFHHNAIIVLSNGIDAKLGALTSRFEHFHEWKRLAEDDAGRVDMETLLKGIFRKENLLDILENFILFDESGGKIVKILAKNHQYLGVNLGLASVLQRKEKQGKLGVFWHTQGSGKSYSMVFFTRKIHRKIGSNFTFLICTDREDLDTQIYKTFAGVGLVENDKDPCRASSGEHLKQLLQEHKSYIFSLIQKFNQDVDPANAYNTREDIIVITDEAHRTQYGRLALNLRNALPKASFLGFTGTPLMKGDADEPTRKVFGEYVSTYDFQRAVDDNATVPLYYDARGEKLGISIQGLNEKIAEKLEEFTDGDLDEKLKLEKELARDYHIITASKRLESIAIDFVEHYSKAWESGKAMFVCIDKLTCVRMYNLIKYHWEEQKKSVRNSIEKSADDQEAIYSSRKLAWMEETRMAVVISEEQNEEDKFQKWDLSILEHRKLMKDGFQLESGRRMDLETAFKDPDHPFRIVFVCAMWLTGFDVPSLSTLYLDKPLKAHTLMQAIARANRVYAEKTNGLIVDYVGILKNLRDALLDFTGKKGDTGDKPPAPPEEELLGRLAEAYLMIDTFFTEKGFSLQTLFGAIGFDKILLLKDAKEAINESSESRRRFEIMARLFFKLFKACINNKGINEYKKGYDAINVIYKSLQEDRENADIDEIIKELQDIVNQSVGLLKARSSESRLFDISKIDFNALQENFKKSKTQKTTVQNLKDAVERKLQTMMSLNPSRVDFQKKYQEIIDDLNNEKNRQTIEDTFKQLIEFIEELSEEEMRASKEGLKEESLAVYDILRKPSLATEEKSKVKDIAKSLFQNIESLIQGMHDWSEKQSTRDTIKAKIRDYLWDDKTGLPASYSDEEIEQKTEEIFLLLIR